MGAGDKRLPIATTGPGRETDGLKAKKPPLSDDEQESRARQSAEAKKMEAALPLHDLVRLLTNDTALAEALLRLGGSLETKTAKRELHDVPQPLPSI